MMKITVIYHGGPEREAVNNPSIVDSPYILYVGTRNAYKAKRKEHEYHLLRITRKNFFPKRL